MQNHHDNIQQSIIHLLTWIILFTLFCLNSIIDFCCLDCFNKLQTGLSHTEFCNNYLIQFFLKTDPFSLNVKLFWLCLHIHNRKRKKQKIFFFFLHVLFVVFIGVAYGRKHDGNMILSQSALQTALSVKSERKSFLIVTRPPDS